MQSKKDWCTGFPEDWIAWSSKFPFVRKIHIADGCEKHDNVNGKGCASHAFAEYLYVNKVIGGGPIFLVSSAVCWIKYPKDQREKL